MGQQKFVCAGGLSGPLVYMIISSTIILPRESNNKVPTDAFSTEFIILQSKRDNFAYSPTEHL